MRPNKRIPSDLAVWGGVECSHVLIGDAIRDQCAEAGHGVREGDLELVAGLGIKVLRYPLLWATVAGPGGLDFTWHDRRFAEMRALGITPIAGFLHHGSGPGGIDPTHPGFVTGLADYAEAAAARFPWIEHYTPINEPVTTARFACLYGHWHPHARDEACFLRAVVASAVGTAEAMRRIRRHNPAAKLVQTEDLGRVFAEADLAHQAAYENERRFLGFDLLAGRVGRGHFFHRRLLDAGAPAQDLDRLADEPCPPDIIGIDHYLTSDRFLDPHIERYPGEVVGGNGRQRYVDIAAAWVEALEPELGVLPRIRETYARYGLPVAVTEVHNGCTREEQLRWLMEAWNAGLTARAEGIPVPAITVWSLFGTLDWNSLLSARHGHYESGAFDTRCEPPRPTAIAHAAAALARTGHHYHPVVELPGWWRRAKARAAIERAPVLLTSGSPADIASFEECCYRRQIPTMPGSAGASRNFWGVVRIETTAGLLFSFRPARGGPENILDVQASAGADFGHVANAFLDLVIDGETGSFRLEAVGPSNQYVAVRLSGPVAAAVRMDLTALNSAAE